MASVLFTGLISNLIGVKWFVDLFGIMLIALEIVRHASAIRFTKNYRFISILFFLFFLATFVSAIVGMYSILLSIKAFRSYVIFIIYALVGFRSTDKNEQSKLFSFVIDCGTLLCLIAILQLFLFDKLPDFLVSFGVNKVFILDNGMARANGLLENSICLGLFSVMLFALVLCKISFEKHSLLDYLKLAIIALAALATYSRFAILGIGLVFIFVVFILKKGISVKKIAVFIVLVIALVYLWNNLGEIDFFSRFLSDSKGAAVSNIEHISDFRNAFLALKNNWITGIGFGTQGYDRGDLNTIITDGTWLTYALEIGVPGMASSMLVFIGLAYISLKNIKNNCHFSAYFIITIVPTIFVANVVNSAFGSKIIYPVFWVFVTIFLKSQSFNEKQRPINHYEIFESRINENSSEVFDSFARLSLGEKGRIL